jgi:hypothetical protein
MEEEKSLAAVLVGLTHRWWAEPVRAPKMDILVALGRRLSREGLINPRAAYGIREAELGAYKTTGMEVINGAY